MASMMAAIDNGVTMADAVRRGLVKGTRERAVWRSLAADIAQIKADGGEVDIRVDVLG